MTEKKKKVLLAVSYGESVLNGLITFLEKHERWLIDLMPDWERRIDKEVWSEWEGDGMLLQAFSSQPLDVVKLRPDIPVICISERGLNNGIKSVYSDNVAIGRLGAVHLLEKGLNTFLFYGSGRHLFCQQRFAGFRDCLDKEGIVPEFLDEADRKLKEVLHALPKPLGVMADSDANARAVARACLAADIPVPDVVAILGVDNNAVLCNLDLIPLSSVEPDFHMMGYEAARLLDHAMAGGSLNVEEPVLIPPLGVVERPSTDMLAVSEPAVVRALTYIREHSAEPVTVPDIARHAFVSRRKLDRLFSSVIGHTPAEELLKTRLKDAQRLLRTTDLSVSDIAEKTGFISQDRLGWSFRTRLQTTPVKYRKAYGSVLSRRL